MIEVVKIASLFILLILYFTSREVVYSLPVSLVIVTLLDYHGLINEDLVWPLIWVMILIISVYAVWSGASRSPPS